MIQFKENTRADGQKDGQTLFYRTLPTTAGVKKNVFFSYFILVVPNFSYMDFFRKCSMFHQSIPLNWKQLSRFFFSNDYLKY